MRSADFVDSSFALDAVSQLDQDVSAALITIREWRNSLVPINRVPTDVLSLIPTYLSSQQDRFRVSFVCRHWRRTSLQHAAIWAQLYLPKGETYMDTLLGRAKGYALDIITSQKSASAIITHLRPYTEQIGCLDFVDDRWANIQKFSEAISGPFPLLHTLKINVANEENLHAPDGITPPSLPLFNNAVNLKRFHWCSEMFPFVNHFAFPNLTTFELSAAPQNHEFHTPQLLDFLEASPTLQTVHLRIHGYTTLRDIPPDRVVVLPNVETFSLVQFIFGEGGYEVAARISCPSMTNTALIHENDPGYDLAEEVLPDYASLNAIARQYTKSPAEELVFNTQSPPDFFLACSLTFLSPDATSLTVGFRMTANNEHWVRRTDVEWTMSNIFPQATRAIRYYPLLAKIKRLHIKHGAVLFTARQHALIVNEIELMFKSLGPLEKLTISQCDVRLYLAPFLDPPGHHNVERQAGFPPIKELSMLYPMSFDEQDRCMKAILGFAKSQHTLGVPFEHVTVCMEELPTAMAESLSPWVGAVDCYERRRDP